MKIQSLQISNVLSFKYHAEVIAAEIVKFEEGLNIIIGENGAGKSTALEVINFLFRRVFYKQFNVNQDLYSRKSSLSFQDKKQILTDANNQTINGFRLEPNWATQNEPQKIRLIIKLDEIDRRNIAHLKNSVTKLRSLYDSYTLRPVTDRADSREQYTFDITLNRINDTFSVALEDGVATDFGYEYLTDYNFYQELINLHNLDDPENPVASLSESFALISGYRNYHAFSTSVFLREQHASQQIQQIKTKDYSKSLNSNDQSEPSIFSLVRLRVAEKHFGLIRQLTELECETQANNLPFVLSINKRLAIVNLECKIKLIGLRTWQYAFEFYDVRRKRVLADINSLSAGQKAIIHLVFEAYGRGDLKGGVVVIDEPEIHLHYQFQHEYLDVVRELNKDQGCQYILVTHSEALINSSTINQVRRFSLDRDGYTQIKAPALSTDQKMLIKILDNTRSTYAFFARKVLLVEGDTDRYFFKSLIQEKYPKFEQEIAVLDIGGKGNFFAWKDLFDSFGLQVYCIGDLDFAIECFYPNEKGVSLKTVEDIASFKMRNPDCEKKIDEAYPEGKFILKNGDLEHYLGISKKGLPSVIEFCNSQLTNYLNDELSLESNEIREMVARVTR